MKTSYKILMTLMGMEIGGAETHVLELCKVLSSQGIEVYVASNGGVYEKELEEWGIVHFKVPLHNKNILNVFSAYKSLKKIILENDIKLVHAHARIPAFLCGLLKSRLNIRFVTTAHGIFKTMFPFNILTNWGERTLAVSEDVKKYLMDNYNVPEKHIKVTINGIDIQKFSSDVDYSQIVEEFGLEKDAYRIVHGSRIDKATSLTAHKLIEAAPKLYSIKNNLEIVIVGGGDDFENVKLKASHTNEKIGKQVIILTNNRIDVNKFVASATVFVGVSRSVLEAMSAERPVVVTGKEGYIGIFDHSKLDESINTNFCCRGCGDTTTEKLTNDIIKLFGMSDEELLINVKFGKKVILDHYSIDTMCKDALDFYELVRYPDRPIDVMISGYYGFNNNGDDAVLKSIVDDLKAVKPNIKIMVLSKNPRETAEVYGVCSIYRFNFFKIKKHLRQTTMLITGGGTLLQDLTSTQSLLYYLFVMRCAHRQGARLMLYANGIGPVRYADNRTRIKKVLKYSQMITLRDEKALDSLKDFNITQKTHVHVTADAAFSLKNVTDGEIEQCLKQFGLYDEKYFIIAVRGWKYISKNFEEVIGAFADNVSQTYGLKPVFLAMQPENDTEISKRIMGLMKCQSQLAEGKITTNQFISIINRGRFVVAMRLHTIIYGVKGGTPAIGLVYDPKVQVMMEMIGQDTFLKVDSVNIDKLNSFAKYICENRDAVSKEIKEKIDVVQQRAGKNIQCAMEILEMAEF